MTTGRGQHIQIAMRDAMLKLPHADEPAGRHDGPGCRAA